MSSHTRPANSPESPRWGRVLLKLSGEALMGDRPFGHDREAIAEVVEEVRAARDLGVQVAIVVGGGNIFRGVSDAADGMDRVAADHMGMLATVMNALALEDAMAQAGLAARAMSAIPMPTVCEAFTRAAGRRCLDDGKIVIFAAGTGNPFFTTDTAAALRAAEMGCEVLLKGTQVDGIYSADPKTDATARRLEQVSYTEVLANDLRVMDATAVTLCRENQLPIIVFKLLEEGNLKKVIFGEKIGSIVQGENDD